jgi:IS1 family transposase
MNVLPREKQIEIVAALVEGCSIRSIERLTGVHRDTVMRLGVQIGAGCAALHDRLMRDLNVPRVELDEIWSYVGKKQRNVKPGETDKGDQYVFVALAGAAKAIIGYRTGKRNRINTRAFVADLRERVLGAPEISSDAFMQYPNAVDLAFGSDCTYGTIDKRYEYEPAREAARRYSPGKVVGVKRAPVIGVPKHISTSYIERQNLTLRMQQRRFGRLTNAFSKKLENHCAAVALYVAHYNLCRVHEAIRVTPAMQIGVSDHIWTIAELVETALSGEGITPSGRRYGRFTVIDGGVG